MMGWPCLTKQQDTVMVLGLNHTLSKFENAKVWNKPCATLPGESLPDVNMSKLLLTATMLAAPNY